MLGVFVSVPVACFRRGLAREYLETEALPPPSTCYGFLLSLVGETNRLRHIGCRIAPVILGTPAKSTVLRTVWRIKKNRLRMGDGNNRTPTQQELLTNVRLLLWLDSIDEKGETPFLEQRVENALMHPKTLQRFGGLSLGESTHLVDEVKISLGSEEETGSIFVCADRGRLTLPVWVNHVGSEGTHYVTGDFRSGPLTSPDRSQLPLIVPPEQANSPKRKKRKSKKQ